MERLLEAQRLEEESGGLIKAPKHVVFTSADGLKASIPIRKALDPCTISHCDGIISHIEFTGGDVLLATEMNDEPLPAEHGYPLRYVNKSLYSWVSCFIFP